MVERRTIPLVPDNECVFAETRAGEGTVLRALQLACLILGGRDPLARQLSVSAESLLDWLQGRSDPPYSVFLAAVEILVLDAEKHLPRS
jgi:hypothetical protein